jgi:hypothetical protein
MPKGGAGTRCVVVLGMHRSGTSVVAGLLHALGVDMGAAGGDEGWVGKHWSNPTGHFENSAFVALDYRLLGGDATGLRGPPDWKGVGTRAYAAADELRALVERFARPTWGWKDPWTVLTIEAFLPYLSDPHFVFVYRPKAEVIASLRKRSTEKDEAIAALYDLYVERLDALRKKLADRPCLVIEYPALIARPALEVQRIIGFLGLRPTKEELDRALGMVLGGEALRRQSQAMAVRGVFGFPQWVGWIVKRDLQHNPSVVASDLVRAVPKEFVQMLRALV